MSYVMDIIEEQMKRMWVKELCEVEIENSWAEDFEDFVQSEKDTDSL